MTALTDTLSPAKMKILKAVATLLEDPAAKITINRIAHQCAVTEAALYRHYRSKDDIFNALLTYMETHILGPLGHVQKAEMAADAASRLHYVYRHYMAFLEGHPGLARLLLGQGNTEAVTVSGKVQMLNIKMRTQVAQILKWAQANGGLNSPLTPEQITELYYGTLVAAAMAQVFTLPQITPQERWEAFRLATFGPTATTQEQQAL